ncbi:sensor histidine kinase [Fusibacillus kribbianus]|uniref:histidine kinase n=1 Tax=Fusibacillus kribbianus TaxID=3044208 RepID=A0AAP4B9F4_9FIRM|nr:HAMP domain-containing sensor histidine kinase [Ruminococcus sp. YH-rum2234]MDI9241297.1 HAMP domain-containing sensor histidine kinase [Ruminococcus sp. YH-rum2234]
MIKKLRRKFILVNMLLVSIVLLITFTVVCVVTSGKWRQESMTAMELRLSRLQEPPEELDKGGGKGRPFQMADPRENSVFVVLLDETGEVKEVVGDSLVIEDEVVDELVEDCLEKEKDSGTLEEMALWYLRRSDGRGTRIAFMDRSEELSDMKSLILLSLLVGVGSLSVFLIISICLSGWVVGPVKEAWEREQRFVADASHELKTPLTVILANTGILMSHKTETIEDQEKWVENTRTEAVRMKGLVDNLLELARADAGTERVSFTQLNFSDLVWSAALPFESVMFEQGKTLRMNIEPDLYVQGDSGKLTELIVILLDNACKYAEEKGIITLTLTALKNQVRLSVHNTGSYIDSEKRRHLFERFYRGEESRSRKAGGYGLGLSIGENIVKLHHGKISVESEEKEGTTFLVVLSRARQ